MRLRWNVLTGLLTVAAALAASPAGADPYGAPDGRTLRCESSDGRTRECPVDAAGGARLLRQLSRSPCIEGETWGRMHHSIWVTQGCRGEFVAFADPRGRYGDGGGYGGSYGGYGPDRGRVVRCGSNDGRWTHCTVDVRGGVDLVRQLSRSQCIRGQSWGVDRGGIWVSSGCRAEFRLSDDVGWQPPAAPGRFRCESNDGRQRTCNADTRGNVRLVRQLSHSPCTPGRTWGVERGGVWVSDGCRAEFEVGGEWADGRW